MFQRKSGPEICKEQKVPDFHGLRDFYALVKTLAKTWPRGGNELDRSLDGAAQGLVNSPTALLREQIVHHVHMIQGCNAGMLS